MSDLGSHNLKIGARMRRESTAQGTVRNSREGRRSLRTTTGVTSTEEHTMSTDRPDLGVPDPTAVFTRLFDEHGRALRSYLVRRGGGR